MPAWTWLLLFVLVIVSVLSWRVGLELRGARRRAAKLARRVKRYRLLVMLHRLERLERDVRDIEDLLIRRRPPAHAPDDIDSTLTRYVAACRGFVRRSAREGGSQEHADAVVRLVLDRLVRQGPGRDARLGHILSHNERARWLGEGAAEGRD